MLNLTYKLGQGCIDLEEGVLIIVIVNPFVCEELLLLSPVFVVRLDFLCCLLLEAWIKNIKSDSS